MGFPSRLTIRQTTRDAEVVGWATAPAHNPEGLFQMAAVVDAEIAALLEDARLSGGVAEFEGPVPGASHAVGQVTVLEVMELKPPEPGRSHLVRLELRLSTQQGDAASPPVPA